MNYEIRFNPIENNRPSIYFRNEDNEKYWMLGELYMCDISYILDDIMPNIEKIRNGEKVPDPTIKHHTIELLDTYSFGYDATGIDFGQEKSIISYNFGENEIEVPSEEIYAFMKDWAEALRKWKNRQQQ